MAGSFKELFSKPLPETPYYIENGVLAKGGIMLMGGESKIGKSFLSLALAHDVASGTPLWGLEKFVIPAPVPVLYVEAELGPYALQTRIKQRYEALGVDPPEGLFYVSKPRGWLLDTSEGIAKLSGEIAATGARVVIIDPVSRFVLGDENSNTDMNRLFGQFNELMIRYPGLSLVLVHHHRKPWQEDETDELSPHRFRGASVFFADPDTLVVFKRLPAGRSTEWWRLKVGFEMRQAENPEGIVLAVKKGGLIAPAAGALPIAEAKKWR